MFLPLQSIKKIKRADRKGSESVTEEKFALLFITEIAITGCESPYSIQVLAPLLLLIYFNAMYCFSLSFSHQDMHCNQM